MDRDFMISWLIAAPYRIRNAFSRIADWLAGYADTDELKAFTIAGGIVIGAAAVGLSHASAVAMQEADAPAAQEARGAMQVVSSDEWSHPSFPLISELPTPEEAAAVTIDEPQDAPRVSHYCQRHPHRRACR